MSHSLVLDATAAAQATALLPTVQTNYAAYLVAHPELPSYTPDLGYVYASAVHVGLSYWRPLDLWPPAEMLLAAQPSDIPTTTTFTPSGGIGNTTVSVNVNAADVTTANAIIAALGGVPNIDAVLACALCTGLSTLSGSPVLRGPFS